MLLGAVGAVRPGVADAVVSMCRMAPRSKRQQRHDAFTRGLQALLDNGVLGVRGESAPHIAVTVDLDFAEGISGSLELHDKGRRRTLKDGRILGPDGWIRP